MKAERIRLSEESSFDRLSVGAVVGSSWSLRYDKLLNAERTRLYEASSFDRLTVGSHSSSLLLRSSKPIE